MDCITVALILVVSLTLIDCCPFYPPNNLYPAYNAYGYDQVQGVSSEFKNADQRQAANSFEIDSRQRRPIPHHYGPFYLTSYNSRPFNTGRPRSVENEPRTSEYLAHMLLANQVGGINNDHMAQLIYDNSVNPQQVPRNSMTYPYSQSGVQLDPRNSMPYPYSQSGVQQDPRNSMPYPYSQSGFQQDPRNSMSYPYSQSGVQQDPRNSMLYPYSQPDFYDCNMGLAVYEDANNYYLLPIKC